MTRLIFFLESYTAGGSDSIARALISNLEFEHIYLVVNKNVDKRILFSDDFNSNVSIHYYGLVTPADIGIYANKYRSDNLFFYLLIKVIDYIARYPLIIISFFYFIKYLKKLSATHFIAHNGGYPGGVYCGTATMASKFVSQLRYRFFAFHSMPFPVRKYLLPLEWIWDRILDRSCNFISVSEASSDELLRVRYIKTRPICIHNGIQRRSLKFYGINKTFRILHVGYLSHEKNQILLLNCLKTLVKVKFVDVHVTFVGDTKDKEVKAVLDYFVMDNGLTDYVTFAGFKDNLDEYYKTHDLLVCTSTIESFPLSILEAMRVGMPVVSTDVGGIKEQVFDGVNGFLVDVDDVLNLVDRIMSFHSNSALIEKMGRKSFEIFQSSYLDTVMISKYNFYLNN
jgi:glycosyltransferase involved in cell wall biosynthesis